MKYKTPAALEMAVRNAAKQFLNERRKVNNRAVTVTLMPVALPFA